VLELTQPVGKTQQAGQWPAGTNGTVVSDHGDVKNSDDDGQMLDLISVPESQLRLITKYS
jgi:hypothetical protein